MSAAESLGAIWQSYTNTVDCLKVVSRCISHGGIEYLKQTVFIGTSEQEAKESIENSRQNADDFVIMTLWAAFERTLFLRLKNESGRMLHGPPSVLAEGVHKKIDNDLEYWRVDDVLNIFKSVVNPDLIGSAKQVKQYRDWIAHRNPKKRLPRTSLRMSHMQYF